MTIGAAIPVSGTSSSPTAASHAMWIGALVMSDCQGRGSMNESSLPDCEPRSKTPGPSDLASSASVLGVFGGVVGGLLTWAFDVDLVWQATGVFLGALVVGGLGAMYLKLVLRVTATPKGDSLGKRYARLAIPLALGMATLGALVGGLIGALAPNGGLVFAVQFGLFAAAVGVGATLFGLTIVWPLRLLIDKAAPPHFGAIFCGALGGCFLGSQLWRAWFEVGWLNLGIPVVGIPMALAIFILHRQTSNVSRSS